MSNANEIRKTLEIVEQAVKVGEDKGKDVKVNIETLARQAPSKGKYDFNKGFLTFQDLMDDPRPFLEKYRKESKRDTSALTGYLAGMKADPKFTDKEKYLRQGYEARGFSNGRTYLVWWKEKKENLIIFTISKEAHVEIRDFLKFFRIIQ